MSRTIKALARTLFGRCDRNARARGWDITVTGRWGTSRVYHDPRYDRLAICPGCAGHGCTRCAGTGRVVSPAATANGAALTPARSTTDHGWSWDQGDVRGRGAAGWGPKTDERAGSRW